MGSLPFLTAELLKIFCCVIMWAFCWPFLLQRSLCIFHFQQIIEFIIYRIECYELQRLQRNTLISKVCSLTIARVKSKLFMRFSRKTVFGLLCLHLDNWFLLVLDYPVIVYNYINIASCSFLLKIRIWITVLSLSP
jgi:hypothetical protein